MSLWLGPAEGAEPLVRSAADQRLKAKTHGISVCLRA
jgi:hypothetical protein